MGSLRGTPAAASAGSCQPHCHQAAASELGQLCIPADFSRERSILAGSCFQRSPVSSMLNNSQGVQPPSQITLCSRAGYLHTTAAVVPTASPPTPRCPSPDCSCVSIWAACKLAAQTLTRIIFSLLSRMVATVQVDSPSTSPILLASLWLQSTANTSSFT